MLEDGEIDRESERKMGGGVGAIGNTELRQALRSLCLNRDWMYAVFWKLKHRSRMVLTWEDAYYDFHERHDSPGNNCCSKTADKLHDGHYSHDPLGLAVAKMSYHVYSLGEGIVGQVAVTGKHQWIFADKQITSSRLSFEYCDGWQTQFSAGIRTIAVVPVAPHGVVQLGSLNKVGEDVKLVNHIRDVFFDLQGSSIEHIPSPILSSMKNLLHLQDVPANSSASVMITDCLRNSDKAIDKEGADVWLSMFPCFGKDRGNSCAFLPHGFYQRKAVEVVYDHERLELCNSVGDESAQLHSSNCNIIYLEHQKLVGGRTCGGDINGCKDTEGGSEPNFHSLSHSSAAVSVNLSDVIPPADQNLLESAVCDRIKLDGKDFYKNGLLQIPEPSDMKFDEDSEKLQFQAESSHMDILNPSLHFPAGYELHEALGPAFLKTGNYLNWESAKTEDGVIIEMLEGMSSSQLTSNYYPDHLLEAVVSNVCQSDSDVKSDKLLSKPVRSLSTTEVNPESSGHTMDAITSVHYPFEQPSHLEEDKQHCLSSSGVCGVISPTSFSSNCTSTCSKHLERSSEPAKNNKKRSRPGENSRPRPRDRQLIQDRIKELRELVPNGSKCSIDSLLERTIKHMLFLQSVTKHADKLNKCTNSKLHDKGTAGIIGSSGAEHGSSWAVEVGGHLKVCSIIVENLNKSGQMLVEMLCEDCSHFLEIAETIRSLGLTILKGATEAEGEKTWICFVVEGQNNRSIHRMDILWSLVQILQPKTAMQP
ncbi:transcription factor bHLH155-like isoform X2 [Juglans microcarpa x Juglans regia]|uniref:transcription factor bHLH155-like isoform X2 n=1 Tax=Juglans microcarpa x Juglans regia TaxID=2249226 RepID=UPI001B7E13E7|nr:transcription factor bHLH155-like isoform X2 [Juglans microcarpa x Juglans regia]